ncbi:MAG TPA: NAD(P)-dependent oxidoreductase [Victivallales bacterium]|nr:NAD(P)-dependent oxidoreductase [Victivallales bacterium]
MKKILIPTKLDKISEELLVKKGYVVVADSETPINELIAQNPDTNAIVVRSEKVTPEIIDALPDLKLVVRAGAGYNTIDTKHARGKNIDVMNTPGANSNAVAEEVIALYLAAYRNIVKGDSSTRAGGWDKKKLMGREITEKTIGIIGLGNIGRLVVKRLQGFDMKFLAYDPFISADYADELGVELMTMPEIFEKADCISLHIPENDETRGSIDKSLFSLMKPGSVLVNCARAGIINEDDLRTAKAEKGLLFCNDVYPKDAAGEKSVTDIADIMLPHLGASTFEANFNAAKRAAKQILDYFEKGITKCVVNKDLPDGLDVNYQKLANIITKFARNYLGENRQPHKIETSFYGDLHQYSKWLLRPIIKGICPNVDYQMISANPKDFLKDSGILFKNRDTEDNTTYGNSMTIDLFEGRDVINKVSIRGTITEGNLIISRINNFDKLYLEPNGNNLFFEYDDRPGVIGAITSTLGDHDININEIRAPQDKKKTHALIALKTDKPVADELVEDIKTKISAINAFFIPINTK